MIVSHLLLILHKKIQFYIFMFEAWNVAKGRKGGQILSQGTVGSLVSLLSCGCLFSVMWFVSPFRTVRFVVLLFCSVFLIKTRWTLTKLHLGPPLFLPTTNVTRPFILVLPSDSLFLGSGSGMADNAEHWSKIVPINSAVGRSGETGSVNY